MERVDADVDVDVERGGRRESMRGLGVRTVAEGGWW